jgi:hypothetical protein
VTPAVHAEHAPSSQTAFVPQVVPFVATPVSKQADVPVAHDVTPVWQALGVHALPATHPTHVPPLHTSFVPHDVPFASAVPSSVHTGTPEVQEVDPVWQAFVGVQVAPVVHALHAPLSQTSFVPQEVPLVAAIPVSVQADAPVVHDVIPVWQAFAGVHARPAVQGTHAPLLHTAFVPHDVPSVAAFPLSVHVDEPEAHDVVPVWQAFAGVQERPVVQAAQVPPLHTWFVPHESPFVAGVPVSVQVATPLAHDVVPTWQALPAGTHGAFAVQGPQAPPTQYMLVPQGVPSGSLSAAVHTGEPDVQTIAFLTHAFGGVQSAPAVQAPQAPPLQTSFIPQEVPFVSGVPVSVQANTPDPHDVIPA